MPATFRGLARLLTPYWLHVGDGGKILFALDLVKDAMVTKLRAGVEARFPSRAPETALALIGPERGLLRGRDESSTGYRARLRAFRYPRGHRVRGSAFALLDQIAVYWGGMRCWTIDVKGNRHTRGADDAETYAYGVAWDWDGQGFDLGRARFWAVLEPETTHPEIIPWPSFAAGTWGGGTFADAVAAGYTIGQQGVTAGDGRAMRGLLVSRRPWKPAGSRAEWKILSFDGTEPAPDGAWQRFQGRDPAFRYAFLRKGTYPDG